MLISPVIPTHNRVKYLRRVLFQIKDQKIADDISIQTIVIVDGSTDGTLEMIAADFPEVHVVQGDGSWFYTKSMNMGFLAAKTFNPDYILTLNDDNEIQPDYIEKLLGDLSTVGMGSILGSISVTKQEPPRITFSGVKRFVRWRMGETPYIRKQSVISMEELYGVFPSPVLYGRGMLIPYALLKKYNYYDPEFVQYGSETDFTLRAVKGGEKVYVSYNAIVYEHHKLTSKGTYYYKPALNEYVKSIFNKYSVNYIGKTLRMYKKHGYKSLYPLFVPLTITQIIINYLKYRF